MGWATANCIIAIAVNLALGSFVLLRAPRESLNRVFLLITLAIATTGIGELIMRVADSGDVILWGARIGAVGWVFLGSLFAHFALVLTRNKKLLGKWQTYAVLYVPSAVFLILAWTTNLVYKGFSDAGEGFVEVEGVLRYPAYIPVILFFGAGILIVMRFWRKAPSRSDREDAFLIMVSAIFMLVFSTITDVILIFTNKQNPPVNVLTASMIMAIVIGYAVTRRGFMSSLTAAMGGTVISIMMDPVLVLDSTGTIERANAAMSKLTGLGEKEIKKLSIEEMLDCEEEGKDVYRRIKDGKVSRCSCECVNEAAERVPVVVTSGSLRSRSGRRMGSVVVIHDMRDTLNRVKAEEDAKIAVVEAEAERRNSEVLRDIIDVACHELRTPASVFKGYSVILRESIEEMDKGSIDEALDSMESAADRVTNLASSLLDASTLERGPLELSLEEVEPSSMVSGSVGVMRKQYPGYRFVVETDGEAKPILADVDMLESVFIILLDNAAKFSPEGSEVKVWFEQDGSQTVFHVEDQGGGIPETQRRKVFERFHQVEDSLHHSLPGLGLGLFIAKRIVEAHGGWVDVQPGETRGSDFRFAIPSNP